MEKKLRIKGMQLNPGKKGVYSNLQRNKKRENPKTMCCIMEPRIYTYYKSVVCQDLIYKCAVRNIMELPKITQIVLNTSSPSIYESTRLLSGQVALQCITGEKSKTTRAHNSIASFNIRKNALLGSATHLRGVFSIYSFLDQYLTFICATENTDALLRSEKNTLRKKTKNFLSKQNTSDSSFSGIPSQKRMDFNFSRNQFTSFPGIQSHFLAFSSTGGFNCTVCISTVNPHLLSFLRAGKKLPEQLFLLLTALQLPSK